MKKDNKGLKTKLTPEEFEQIRGTRDAHQFKFNETSGKWERNMRKIKSLLKAWNKSPKFLLQLVSNIDRRFYLSKDNELTPEKKHARQFAMGFDDPDTIVKKFNTKLDLVFKVENYGKEKKQG